MPSGGSASRLCRRPGADRASTAPTTTDRPPAARSRPSATCSTTTCTRPAPVRPTTFWTGLGAVRRDAFLAVGGFDGARYPHPSIEDIELGRRLFAAGGPAPARPARSRAPTSSDGRSARCCGPTSPGAACPGWRSSCAPAASPPRSTAAGGTGSAHSRACSGWWSLLGARWSPSRSPRTLIAAEPRLLRAARRSARPGRGLAGVALHGLHHLVVRRWPSGAAWSWPRRSARRPSRGRRPEPTIVAVARGSMTADPLRHSAWSAAAASPSWATCRRWSRRATTLGSWPSPTPTRIRRGCRVGLPARPRRRRRRARARTPAPCRTAVTHRPRLARRGPRRRRHRGRRGRASPPWSRSRRPRRRRRGRPGRRLTPAPWIGFNRRFDPGARRVRDAAARRRFDPTLDLRSPTDARAGPPTPCGTMRCSTSAPPRRLGRLAHRERASSTSAARTWPPTRRRLRARAGARPTPRSTPPRTASRRAHRPARRAGPQAGLAPDRWSPDGGAVARSSVAPSARSRWCPPSGRARGLRRRRSDGRAAPDLGHGRRRRGAMAVLDAARAQRRSRRPPRRRPPDGVCP